MVTVGELTPYPFSKEDLLWNQDLYQSLEDQMLVNLPY
jgi:hypothetical protein